MPDPQLQSIVEKMVAAGEPEENISLVIQHYKPAASAQPAAPHKEGYLESGGMFGEGHVINGLMNLAKAAYNHPVTAGALAGGMLAAPLTGGASIPAAMAASGLGAAGGAGLGSIANAAIGKEGGPKTAGDVAKTMALEGAAGAAGEGLGQGAAKLLRVGGKLVYKAALRPSMPLQREFGDIAETGLREGVRVSEGGARQAGDLLSESASKAKGLIQDAQAAGAAPIRIKDVAGSGGIGEVNQRAAVRARTGLSDERPAITGRIKAMQAQNPNGITLDRAQTMKGELQDLAGRVYRAQEKGAPVLDLSADTNAALARGLRSEIAKSAEAAGVPGVHAANERTQEMIGLNRAMEDANRRNIPGVGSIRSLLGDFIPSVSSTAAIEAHRIGQSSALPNSLRAALIAALGGGD
jgi:hypothetical protein